MRRILLLAGLTILVAGLAILTLPVRAQGGGGRIEGHVTNLTTGNPPSEPLPSVEVLVNDWMVLRSGAEGEWNVTGLPPGQYEVRLNLPSGYSPAQEVITASIWGDNTEVVDLGYYEGETAPPSTPAAGEEMGDRVQTLGATPTPAAVAVVAAMTETAAMSATAVTTGAAVVALPAQAGVTGPPVVVAAILTETATMPATTTPAAVALPAQTGYRGDGDEGRALPWYEQWSWILFLIVVAIEGLFIITGVVLLIVNWMGAA